MTGPDPDLAEAERYARDAVATDVNITPQVLAVVLAELDAVRADRDRLAALSPETCPMSRMGFVFVVPGGGDCIEGDGGPRAV